MKIGEVEIGSEYGALDSPKASRYVRRDPRQVKVLEIVTVEETVWSNYSSYKKNMRRLKVEVLDIGPGKDSWRYGKIEDAAKGAKLVIEARQLVGTWAELSPGIFARIEEERSRVEIEEALEARIAAIVGKKAAANWDSCSITVRRANNPQAEFSGKTLDKILTLAEAGKAKESRLAACK